MIDLLQLLVLAHRGWLDTSVIPLDSGVRLLATFEIDPEFIVDLFETGLQPIDIIDLIRGDSVIEDIIDLAEIKGFPLNSATIRNLLDEKPN